MRRFLRNTVGRAGHLKVFILGLTLGLGVGIMAGRVAERLRLSDFVAIEQMIQERERSPDSQRHRPSELPLLRQPFRM